MKTVITMTVLVIALWMMSLSGIDLQNSFFFWRGQLTQITGEIAICLMSVLLLMATRPRWLEQWFGGLDKLYKAHKTIGISAGVMTIMHWAIEKSPGWLSSLGLLTLGARPPHGTGDMLKGLMKQLGEFAFYSMIVLIIISLVKAVPYKHFKLIHKLGAVIALMAVAHSVYLVSSELTWTPFGIFNMLINAVAAVCLFISLFGKVGSTKKIVGEVASVHSLNESVLEVEIKTDPAFFNLYKSGMFAFITFDKSEGGHPFTIVSADQVTHTIKFAIKALGDYTNKLSGKVQEGQIVSVEGPYGMFTLPGDTKQEQRWIGAGIGITPFISWLETSVKLQRRYENTTLIYTANDKQDLVYADKLTELAQKVGVRLVLWESNKDGFMSIDQLKGSDKAKYWFCGPEGMKQMLLKHIRPNDIHFEYFDFR